MLKAAKAYLSTQVGTASKGDLLLMLYDTAIKQLKQAVVKIQEKDYAAKGVLISKAITIVSELQESLNKEQGGEVTKNLFQVYFFCNARLLKANMEMSIPHLEEVIGILSGLRQAFAQIIPTHEGNSTATGLSPFQTGPKNVEVESAPIQAAPVPAEPIPAEPAAEPAAAPVQTVRFRAASAYANSR